MPTVLVYPIDDGLAISHLAESDLSADAAAAAVVPEGTPYRFVSLDSLPKEPNTREAWVANFDDEPCVVSVDPVRAEALAKEAARKIAREAFDSAIREGFVAPGGWKLGLEQADVVLLTGNFVMAQAAAAANLPIPPVIDTNGVVHEFDTLEDLTALMMAYGQYRAQLSADYSSSLAAIG